MQHLTLEEMYYPQPKGLCYNCDKKFVKGHKCREQKFFHMDMHVLPTLEKFTCKGL